MLPDSNLSSDKAERQPAMFADTGMPLMLQRFSELKAKRENLRAFVAGGASVIKGSDMFKVGERNIEAVKKAITSLAIPVIKADIGGVNNRNPQLSLETGTVILKTVRMEPKLLVSHEVGRTIEENAVAAGDSGSALNSFG